MSNDAPRPARRPVGEVLIALGALGVASYLAYGAAGMPAVAGYARVGPRLFPQIVAGGFGLLGVLLLVEALRGSWRREAAPVDGRALGFVAAGLLAAMALLQTAGFVFAATAIFALTAIAFGSRRYGRDLAVGLILGLIIYLGFTRLLNLNLPAGVLPF